MSEAAIDIACELRALADRLEQSSKQPIAQTQISNKGVALDAHVFDRSKQSLVLCARAELKRRESREKFFDDELFGEPAWNMLLDLYVHDKRGTRLSVTSAAAAARCPATTALRYIDVLVQQGLATRHAGETDKRVTFLDMTRLARSKIEAYLRDCTADADERTSNIFKLE